MRILIDATTARDGGGKTFVRHMLPALARQKRGHQYSVLLSSIYQTELISELNTAISCIECKLPVNPFFRGYSLQRHVPYLVRKYAFNLLFTVAELGCMRPPCPHVVMVQNHKFFTPLSVHASLSARLRLAFRQFMRKPLVYRMLKNADHVVFVSESIRKAVRSSTPLFLNNTTVVPHGIDKSFFDCASSDSSWLKAPYILYVAALSRHKNIETLLRAFPLISQAQPKMRLVIAGSTNDEHYLNLLLSMVRSLSIAHKVDFIGSVEYTKLPALYRGACAFVFPSLLESFGLPLLEAMACGTPVIASNLSVCREVCEDAALYFEPCDEKQLANTLIRVLNNPATAADMSRAGRHRAMQFSWESSAEKLANVFEETFKNSKTVRTEV